MKYNTGIQFYKGIGVQLIVYTKSHFERLKAKRFMIMDGDKQTSQNLWVPNSCLYEDGTIKTNYDLDWIFFSNQNLHKYKLAGLKIRKSRMVSSM